MRLKGVGLGLLKPCGRSALGLIKSLRGWRGSSLRGLAAGNDGAFATTFPFGLTNPGATHKFYTTQLDVDAPLLLRDTRADFWQAALTDAAARGLRVEAYLKAASHACSKFLDSSVVHNGDEVKRALLNMCKAKGQFGLFLGGKNVGKSLLLTDLSRTSFIGHVDDAFRAVVKIDGRTCGTNLTYGLEAAIANEEREQKRAGIWSGPQRPQESSELQRRGFWAALRAARVERAPAPELRTPLVLRVGDKGTLEVDFSDLLSMTLAHNMAMLNMLLEIVEDRNMHLCLIIDEGDLAFPAPPPPGSTAAPLSEEKRCELKQTRTLLNRLVELTKQSRRINVLITVTDCRYPYLLQSGRFFNPANFTNVIFAGEVPPADMRVLLQEKWNLGPRLADVFLAYYGGHVHIASQALAELATTLDRFDCQSVAPIGTSLSIASCLCGSPDDGRSTASAVLRDMAGRGFAPIRDARGMAELVAENDVGNLVGSHATVVGTPHDVRTAGGANQGVVPSSNFIRHMIAKALYDKGKADAAAAAQKADASARAVLAELWARS